MNNTMETTQKKEQVITPAELLAHWQGHRNLTRNIINAFPEKELFAFSIGGMRTFADMVQELLGIGGPGVEEFVTGVTAEFKETFDHGNSKETLLQLWDDATQHIHTNWAKLTEADFHREVKSFGVYEGTVQSSILYFIDNEIHHRAQGYVYLRALGITPPEFWNRQQ